ncbi:GNAT family N-acetyltransferase [Helicobacter pylori]|uniref:GNAT family N-acetyltransferase n=1 Tax=Helicobacter pylori TaxID=210 RepID=UPI0002BB8810|nr:GNAT family N-acetyltransferase [Helicobacter pylori]EMG85030.1 acetyltransferase, GNAT family [Helicobacter pylori GAM112Ai]EMH35597.1 acetyltransferase, GNAT family [Helicobacter pylori GAM42Ai]
MTIKIFSPKDPTELEEFYAERIADNPLGFIQRLDLLPSISGFVQKLREHGGELFEMREGKKLIGICGLNHINQTEAELCKFHINTAYQSQGLGQKLYESVERYAFIKGYTKISLHVSKSQIKACNLYQKLGFVRIKEEDCVVELGEEALIFPTLFMEKILS